MHDTSLWTPNKVLSKLWASRLSTEAPDRLAIGTSAKQLWATPTTARQAIGIWASQLWATPTSKSIDPLKTWLENIQ